MPVVGGVNVLPEEGHVAWWSERWSLEPEAPAAGRQGPAIHLVPPQVLPPVPTWRADYQN